MPITKVDAFQWSVCDHVWISSRITVENPPIACAKCKSPYWNREKKEKIS